MAEFDDNTSPDDDLNGVAIGMEENDGSPTSDGGSSSGWSDEEGDEYLAKALASDAYLRVIRLPRAVHSTNTTEFLKIFGQNTFGGIMRADPPQKSKMALKGSGVVSTSPSAAAMVAGAVNVAGSSASFHTSAGDSHIGGQALKGDAAHSECSSDQERTILIHHPLCELHDIPDHPERPGRVRAIMNALTRKFPGMRTLLAPEAHLEQVLRFHTQAHVDEVLRLCSKSESRGRDTKSKTTGESQQESPRFSSGRGDGRRAAVMWIDSDTAIMPTSREAILRAAGAACYAVDEVVSGRAGNAFCCVRPPGHHAEPGKAMGFCYFNNAAIGALHAQAESGVERVAVVDIDVHHGNGTQALFEANPTTFYASTHQGPHFYPWTGADDMEGVASNIVNVNMGSGEGSRGFRRAYSEKILPALEDFGPGLIVISAGFDAHKDDPLAGIVLDEEDYSWVTREICELADKVCEGRVVSILEGGYNLQAISSSAVAHVDALQTAARARTAETAPAPIAANDLGPDGQQRCANTTSECPPTRAEQEQSTTGSQDSDKATSDLLNRSTSGERISAEGVPEGPEDVEHVEVGPSTDGQCKPFSDPSRAVVVQDGGSNDIFDSGQASCAASAAAPVGAPGGEASSVEATRVIAQESDSEQFPLQQETEHEMPLDVEVGSGGIDGSGDSGSSIGVGVDPEESEEIDRLLGQLSVQDE